MNQPVQTLEQFRATHEVSHDFDRWRDDFPINETGETVAVHIYRDRSGSTFGIVQQTHNGHTWFEYDWHPGANSFRDNLADAEAALFEEFAIDWERAA